MVRDVLTHMYVLFLCPVFAFVAFGALDSSVGRVGHEFLYFKTPLTGILNPQFTTRKSHSYWGECGSVAVGRLSH